MIVTLPAVAGVERTSWAFLRALVRLCQRVDVEPGYLLAVMSSETARTFSPSIHPPNGNAVGLIQFLPSTARALGTTAAELARMSQVGQLVYVEKFFAPHRSRHLRSRRPVDTYLAVFAPQHIGEPMSSSVFNSPSAGYRANKGLDKNDDGTISVSEVDAIIQGVLKGAAKRAPLVVDVWPSGAGEALVLASLGAAVVGAYLSR